MRARRSYENLSLEVPFWARKSPIENPTRDVHAWKKNGNPSVWNVLMYNEINTLSGKQAIFVNSVVSKHQVEDDLRMCYLLFTVGV